MALMGQLRLVGIRYRMDDWSTIMIKDRCITAKQKSMAGGTTLMLLGVRSRKGGTSCLMDGKSTMMLTTMAMVRACCMECKRLVMTTTTSTLDMVQRKAV